MLAPAIVFIVRFLVPFSIVRFPFWGALLSIAADASDVIILDALGWGIWEGEQYHAIDKLFDAYYLSFELIVSLKWRELAARRVSAALFAWRMAGDLLFELTGIRQILFFTPNIFENFYLIVTGLKQFFPRVDVGKSRAIVVILLVGGIPKIVQEYIMHYLEFPTWAFIKHNIFRRPG